MPIVPSTKAGDIGNARSLIEVRTSQPREPGVSEAWISHSRYQEPQP